MIRYKGYTGVFEYDPDLHFFAGHVVDLKDLIYFEGHSVNELRESMAHAVEGYLDVCEERGEDPDKPFSGQLRLRMESDLHRSVTVAAATEGVSLNAWVQHVLRRAIESDFQPTDSRSRTQR